MADDVEIDFEKMSLWSKEDAERYFESGGTDEPKPVVAPEKPAQMPLPPDEVVKKWFPKYQKLADPKVRERCADYVRAPQSKL